ncbi:YqaA family protein [Thiomicrorhabdus cannonii]|uniref:YqaA family protein n=1 Tax=Thiomicrorhabdus cannonii TaxID=2748011 RepID=UPI0015C14078|nr:YqaA family protein [Thiomicrorhabdus cannonii]
MSAYLSLFAVSFIAATLLPAGSEVLLGSLLLEGYEPWALWAWATAGNTLGAAVNYGLGRYLLHFQHRRWFPFKADTLHKSQSWFNKYGVWSLLFSWMPLFGDALTFIAGMMRVNFGLFVLLTFIGKGVRYAVLVGLVDWFAA